MAGSALGLFMVPSCRLVLALIRIIDHGRSLVDIRASSKLGLQTDHRLIRRAAMFALIIAYGMVESLLPKG